MNANQSIERIKRIGGGLALILMPLMLLSGFLMHPNLMSLELIRDADVWVREWRGNRIFHVGHLIVLLAVPVIITVAVRSMRYRSTRGDWPIFLGGVLGVFGAFVLAVDKGALTLVLTAFDTLSDAELVQIAPALQVLLDREGWLWLVQFLILLPLGFALQAVGLARARVISKARAWVIVVGLLLLLAGDIEIVTAAGAALMCVGYIPMGIRELRGELNSADVARSPSELISV